MKSCEYCDLTFAPRLRSYRQRFCSPRCKQAMIRKNAREHPLILGGIEKPFWSRVNKTETCWEWTGGTHQGYGRIVFKCQDLETHRVSWILENGAIPDGLWALHKCDNRKCVRPDHLFLGDIVINTLDRDSKNRQVKGSRSHLAKLNDEQVKTMRVIYRDGKSSACVLAARFGISKSTVHRIIQRHTWKHL